MPFVKLDCGILDSTLWFNRTARDVFLTALLLAVPKHFDEPVPQIDVHSLDETGWSAPPGDYGFVSASGPGILHRALVDDRAAGMLALELLGSPELDSRSQEHNGRRMIRINGGYLLLNYAKYREQDRTNAERQKRYRQKSNAVTPQDNGVTPVTKPLLVTQAEAEAEAEERKDKDMGQQTGPSADETSEAPVPPQPLVADFKRLRELYPKRDGSHRWADAERHYRARLREGATALEIEDGVLRYARYCHARGLTGTAMVQQAATFLGTNRGYAETWEVQRKPVLVRDASMGEVLR